MVGQKQADISDPKSNPSQLQIEQWTNLRSWMSSHGARIGAIEISTTPVSVPRDSSCSSFAERGLRAKADIVPSSELLHIPEGVLISATTALQNPTIAAIHNSAKADDTLLAQFPDAADDCALLILFLLHEQAVATSARQAGTPWKAYLDTLPQAIPTALTVDEDTLNSALSRTPLLPIATALRNAMHALYEGWFLPHVVMTYSDAFPASVCTFEAFCTAHAVVESRAFKLDGETLLTPLADMLNEAPPWDTPSAGVSRCDCCTPRTALVLRAKHATIPAGAEITIRYGDMPNWQLLLHYGFTHLANPYDSLDIELAEPDADAGSSPEDAQSATKKMLILHVVLEDPNLAFSLTRDNPFPSCMLAAMRVLQLQGDEFHNAARHDFSVPVSARNERATIAALRDTVRSVCDHDAIPVTNINDEDNGDSRNGFTRACRIYRRSLSEIAAAAQAALQKLAENLGTV